MQRTILTLLAATAAAHAQDFVFPLGFGSASGPPANSYPVARARDQNGDGVISQNEIYAFATTLPTTASSGISFMTDGRVVVEDGEPAFYFTDSEDGQVLRCVDRDHDGVIDPNEAAVFFRFGLSSSGGALFAPDTLGVHRDPATNQTRVYVALDNGTPSGLGFTKGIHRLVDNNGDGDAMDPGEQSLFVSGTMGLTVQGLTGPVTITRDFWRMVRVLPGGKVIAFAQGASVNGTLIPNSNPPAYTYTYQPEMNCWYGFTDNNGTAVPEVWFNASILNNLPVHPSFDDPRGPTTSLFPNWDIQSVATPGRRNNYARFCDVVPGGGPNGEPVYYLASSYRTVSEGDVNLNGQQISGLVYRVVDQNLNQVIDPGEINLYCNVSSNTYAGVPPISFPNHNQTLLTSFNGFTYGFTTSADGGVHILWDNGGPNKGVVTLVDQNRNGVIDQGEAYTSYATPSPYLPPFSQTNGPYLDDFAAIGRNLLPGPFGAGITPIGDGCRSTTVGTVPVMDVWNGIPQVGNLALEIGAIRALPLLPAFVLGDFWLAPTPVNLSVYGMGPACLSYLATPTTIGFVLADQHGVLRQPVGIPANPGFLGVPLAFQFVLFEPAAPTPLPYIVSNALHLVVQP
ncbi:MAG: hypothetical protein FJ265_08455 [Planctomycetes bacterium]|nr:hypothetical protein [Planctomycetota bacterium]